MSQDNNNNFEQARERARARSGPIIQTQLNFPVSANRTNAQRNPQAVGCYCCCDAIGEHQSGHIYILIRKGFPIFVEEKIPTFSRED